MPSDTGDRQVLTDETGAAFAAEEDLSAAGMSRSAFLGMFYSFEPHCDQSSHDSQLSCVD